MYHTEILHPLQPARNICRQVAAKKLCGQCVQGADCNRDLHVHAKRSHEKSDALLMEKTFLLAIR